VADPKLERLPDLPSWDEGTAAMWQRAIAELAAKKLRFVMRHRERYVKAWIAATGLHPTECKMVELHHPPDADGTMRVTIQIERK
jgi:predicted urease superfamily metal-dependent hydrolase